MTTIRNAITITFICLLACGCDPHVFDSAVDEGQLVKSDNTDGKADSSAVAVFLDVEFDGELWASYSYNPKSQIEDQLLYTVGQLNGDRSISRIDRLELSNIKSTQDGGKTLITYHAKTVVAWGRRYSIPDSYTFKLPRDMSYQAQQAFIEKYSHSCVDWSAHDVDSGTMWYYWRPEVSRCHLDQDDIIEATASVTMSDISTTGKYPEYHRVWKDNVLKVVAVFGKYESGETSGDAGISAYNSFVRSIRQTLEAHDLTTVPPTVPRDPGVDVPDVEFSATLPGGKRVEVVALLVDSVRSAGYTFNQRYEDLSSHADLIAYNGHSGLGANIRHLANRGRWIKGQYAIVFMNGCDTYAYVDSALADAHAAVNADDPAGTKYLDVVTNAMPSFFSNMSRATLALFRGLLAHEAPKTYEQIFANISSSQVVLVSGEEDNVYVPGYSDDDDNGGDSRWEGLQQSGTVAQNEETRFQTPDLAPGRYLFALSGDNDADLYVRIGSAPSTRLYDCRPYKYGSDETCVVELNTTAPIHVMVRGWADSSSYHLVGGID
jgi:hypothetical protein